MYILEGRLTGPTKPPSVERPWGDHTLQALRVGMDQIGLHLAIVAFLYKNYCVLSHSGQIVSHLKDALV